MNNLAYKYISTISFSDLYNWSFQYAQKCENLFTNKYKCVSIGSFLVRIKDPVDIEDNQNYKRVSIKLYNGGITLRDIELGVNIGTKKQFRIKQGHFLLSKIDARNGAIGIVPESCNDAIITGNFWDFEIDTNKADPQFLSLLMTTDYFVKLFDKASNGTTNRHYLQEDLFLKTEIPLPSLDIQKEFVKKYNDKIKLAHEQEEKAKEFGEEIDKYINESFGINTNTKIELNKQSRHIRFIQFKNLSRWDSFFFNDKFNIIDSCFSQINFKCNTLGYYTQKLINGVDSREYVDKGIPYLRVSNIKPNKIDEADIKYIKESPKNIKGLVKEDDILITRKGTYGNAYVANKGDEKRNFVISSEVFKLTLKNKQELDPLYVQYYINSSFCKIQMERVKTRGIMGSLTQEALLNIQIPIPSINIQKEMVEHIAELNNIINKMSNLAEQNKIAAQEEFEKELFE